ncbi:MAG TPA: hypothetical protein VEW69_03035 [Alphaproteobacteria bacterium]|nr:hypothetical protein [Alphaproteobacteria bacterium]
MKTSAEAAKPIKHLLVMFAVLLFSAGMCLAQEEMASADGPAETAVPYVHVAQNNSPAPAEQSNGPTQQDATQKTIVVPAGTRVSMVMARPLRVKSVRPGDPVYLQIAFPVTVDGTIVIPPGTYVQGVIDQITRRNGRYGFIEFQMSSGKFIFNNGYTAPIPGMTHVVSAIAGVSQPPQYPGKGNSVPVMAATAPPSPGLPPLPSLGNGPRNALIGIGVAAVAGTVLLAVLYHAHDPGPVMERGAEMEMVLQEALYLDRDQVALATHQYGLQTPIQPPATPAKSETCYTAGDPGTPDTVIPGTPPTPGTPPSGDFPGTPGTPGTPDTVIPGRPATPPQAYPCRK